jgi:hypothetical protein
MGAEGGRAFSTGMKNTKGISLPRYPFFYRMITTPQIYQSLITLHDTKIWPDFSPGLKVLNENVENRFEFNSAGPLNQTIFSPDLSLHCYAPN